MLWKFVQHSFAGGILDRALQGRQDLERYFSSASKIKNFIVRKQGDIVKRRGTDEVCSLAKFLGLDRNGGRIPMRNIRLIPVTRSDEDGRYLFITGGFCGVASKDGVMTVNDALFVRDLEDYRAEDEFGNALNFSDDDTSADDDTPYEVVHMDASGVSTKRYSSLQDAINACISGDTVRLRGDVDLSDAVPASIAKGKSVVVDLFGHSATIRRSVGFSVMDGASLKVTNSSGVRSTVYELSSGVPSIFRVGNSQAGASDDPAKLVIDGNVSFRINSNDGSVVRTYGTCEVRVVSGDFVANEGCSAMFHAKIGHVELYISGGSFDNSKWDGVSRRAVIACESEYSYVSISGGRFSTAGDSGVVVCNGSDIEISGGMFTVPDGRTAIAAIQSSVDISRGSFSSRSAVVDGSEVGIDRLLAFNAETNSAFPDGDGMYGIRESDEPDYSYSIEDDSVKIPYRMKVPYLDDDIGEIDYKQSGDTVFLTHRDYPPMKVVFTADGFANASVVRFDSDGVRPPVLADTEMQNNSHSSTTTVEVFGNQSSMDSGKPTSKQTSTTSTKGASKTIRYCVTYVKDGVESKPSNSVSVTYEAPWMQTAVVPLSWTRGENGSEPDYYNVYKDNGGGFGLIGTSRVGDDVVGPESGRIPDDVFFTHTSSRTAVSAAEFMKKLGVGASGLYRLMSASRSGDVSGDGTRDTTLVVADGGPSVKTFVVTFADRVVGNAVAVDLDGRYYDSGSNMSYLIPSSGVVSGEVVLKTTSGTKTVKLAASTSEPYADWEALAKSSMPCGSGSLSMCVIGAGLQEPYFSSRRRRVAWSGFNPSGLQIVSLKLSFKNAEEAPESPVQAVIHGVKVMKSLKSGTEFEDNYITPKMEITPPRSDVDPHFSTAGDYPACIDFYQQRMVVASSRNDPFRFWMSMVGDLYNFCSHETMQENDPIEAETAAKVLPNINRILVTRDMILFTDGGEYKVAPVQGNTLSYKTVSAKLQSEIGIANWLKPACVKDEIVFVDRTGRNVFATKYNFSTDGYDSKELSVMSQDIFRENMIVDMAYRRHPESMLEFVQEDGTIADMVYMEEQGVTAWVKQELGGGFMARCIACPETTNRVASTEAMLAVERDGDYRLWLCRPDTDSDEVGRSVCLDGVVEFMGSEIAGAGTLDWVAVGEGGDVFTRAQYEAGDATPDPSARYFVGYEYDAELVTVRPEAQGERSSMQFEIKDATEVEVRTLRSGQFTVKAYGLGDNRGRLLGQAASFDAGRIVLPDRDCKGVIAGNNSRDGRIVVKSRNPYQLNICYLAVTYQIEPENGGSNNG